MSQVETGTKEYPERLSQMEMTLVRMLRTRRSWACYMDIIKALQNIQLHAGQMQEEMEHLFPDKCEEATERKP